MPTKQDLETNIDDLKKRIQNYEYFLNNSDFSYWCFEPKEPIDLGSERNI